VSRRDDVRILLVDDSRDKLLSLGALLADPGREVVEARSGREALRHLLSGDFALILLDINMPDMDGFETAALIRKRKSSEHTPIIFITAYSDDIHSLRGYSLGAVDYIVTPVVPEVLQSKVSFFVELFRKTEQIRGQSEALQKRARQLHRLTQASLAINSAGSAAAIESCVTAAASSILEARQVVLAPMPGESWGKLPVREKEVQRPDLTASLTGHDGRAMGTLQLFGKESSSYTGEDQAILTQLAQIAAVAIENVISAEARETNRLKDEFLATLSHELRTPLTAILSWARVLRLEQLDPERFLHGLDVIERNVNAQAKLIDDLLEISRVSNSKVRLAAVPMRVVPVVEAVLEAMRPAIEAKELGSTLAVTPEAAAADRVSGDPDRLQQVFSNLVSNAVKFTRKGRRIDVRIEKVDSQISVSVSDTGKGISPEFLEHVFDRFRQEDSSPTRSYGGLGIGLAIVRHLVELHNGTVTASSPGIGKGSTFTVRLPIFEGAAREAPPARIRCAAPDLSGVRVLLVDDDFDTREVVGEILRAARAKVSLASSMSEALEALAREKFDVLVSDIAMPGGDGYELIRKVRELPPERGGRLPAVALSAYVRREDRSRALSEGFQRHISKPIEPNEFLAGLAELVGRLPEAETAPPADRGTAFRVLIVEDDPDSRLGLKALLELRGYEVEVAEDGPAGLRRAAEIHPDLALVDVGLPGMDGYEVAASLRESANGKAPYMIALSGFDDDAHRRRARDSGFDDYLVKPIRPENLERVVSGRARRAPRTEKEDRSGP
jgi:CheY-like chemotaxis protein